MRSWRAISPAGSSRSTVQPPRSIEASAGTSPARRTRSPFRREVPDGSGGRWMDVEIIRERAVLRVCMYGSYGLRQMLEPYIAHT